VIAATRVEESALTQEPKREPQPDLRHELNQDNAVFYCNLGSTLREAGRFDLALAEFDQAITLKPDYAEAHNNRGIVLANLGRMDEALAAFDRAIAAKPDYAEAYSNRGLILSEIERFNEALASFDRALALRPNDARVYSNRGTALQGLKRFDEALASFETAITLQPDYAQAHYNCGLLLHDLNRLDESLAQFDKAIALVPDYVQAHHNRGAVLQDLNRLGEAILAYDKALALMPGYPEAFHNQSHCYLKLGRFDEGWRLHEWRKELAAPVGSRLFAQPLWLGREDLANKTLFVHCEQGLGDTIQFCRYGKLLRARGARVVMSVQQPLLALLRQFRPDIQIIAQNDVPVAFDYHCPLLSLPLALGTTLDTIPSEPRYLWAAPELRDKWRSRLPSSSAKPRIGFAWRGSPEHKNDANRSVDLSVLAPLISEAAAWVSLQNDITPAESAVLAGLPQIVDLGRELRDFSDTAAVVDVLDLVIVVDTSIAHLAGAMGKPVWLLLPFNSDWRWLMDRDDSPWYPSARLFRQRKFGAWPEVIARVQAALDDLVRSRKA
jgi:tetratricopeptide (TPR) repeat protein